MGVQSFVHRFACYNWERRCELNGTARAIGGRRNLMDSTTRKILLLNLDDAMKDLLDIREELSTDEKQLSLTDVMEVSDLPTYRRKIGLKKMHKVGRAVGMFEGAASALRVPVESLMLELWECRESGLIDQWMNDLRASIGIEPVFYD
jgi:hypothetical protein